MQAFIYVKIIKSECGEAAHGHAAREVLETIIRWVAIITPPQVIFVFCGWHVTLFARSLAQGAGIQTLGLAQWMRRDPDPKDSCNDRNACPNIQGIFPS